MTESKKTILEILNNLQALGFGSDDLVDYVVDVKQKEKADYEADGFDFEYFEKEETKDDYITSEKAKMFEMIEFRNKYFTFSNQDGLAYEANQKATQLFEKLKSVPLSEEEFNELHSLVREVTFYQMLANTLDLGIHMSHSNIAIVNSEGFRSNLGRASIPVFFNEKFKWLLENKDNAETRAFDVNDANNMLFNLVPDRDLEDISLEDTKEETVRSLIEETDELYKDFERLQEDYFNSFKENGYVDIETVIEMHNVWDEYILSFTDAINKCQKMNIDKYIGIAKEHRMGQDADSNIYKVGDESFSISKDNLVDDLAKFARALEAYEKGEKVDVEEVAFEPIEPIEIADVSMLDNKIVDEETPKIEEPVVSETEPEIIDAIISTEPEKESDNDLVDRYADFVLGQEGYENVSREEVIKVIEANPDRLEKFAEALDSGMITIPVKNEEVTIEPETNPSPIEPITLPTTEEVSFEEISNDISGIDVNSYEKDPSAFSNEESQFGDYASIPDGYSIPVVEGPRRGAR